ncbi:hypothetical protein ABTZ03_00070 [Kitasatospora sp. NPDC096077]|uniref:Imm32 family immunity protein n=1 Tax=Kitasatospora sp. NPDC096077 TaxID=3155544 RepID=UPI00332D7849
MRLDYDTACDCADLSATAEEYERLADAVAADGGRVDVRIEPGVDALAGIEVTGTAGPGVLLGLDSERRVLVVSGDDAGRALLADILRDLGSYEDGGHLHIEYHPGHYYLVEGSVALIASSPHGGMPRR